MYRDILIAKQYIVLIIIIYNSPRPKTGDFKPLNRMPQMSI